MRLTHRIFLENALCIVALVVLALCACYPIVIFDRAPVAASATLFEPPWEEARPPDFPVPDGEAHEETFRQFFPWYVFLNDAARHGDSLLWNPLEGGGLPFLALWRTRCLSPFSIPFYLMASPSQALQVSVLLKLLVAGLGAFYVARKFGFRAPTALFVATTFEFSGPVFLFLGWPLSDVTPWLPLWLMFIERFAMGQARYWPLGAIMLALMALGGDPDALMSATAYGILFLFARLMTQKASALRAPVLSVTACLVVGTALAAIQIVPYIEFVSEAGKTGRSAPASLGLTDLALCFLPHLFGNGAVGGHTQGFREDLLAAMLVHVGLVPLLLAPLWFALRRFAPELHRRRIECMLIATLFMTSVSLTVSALLPRFPALGVISPGHLLIGNVLAFAFAGAAAAEEWLELNADQCQSAIVRLLVFFPLLVLCALLVVRAGAGAPRPPAPPLAVQVAIAGSVTAIVLVLIAGTIFRPSLRVMGYGLSALSFATLFLAFFPAIAYVDRHLLFPETGLVRELKESRVRLSGSRALKRWPLAGNLVAQIYCPSGVELKRYTAVMGQAQADPALLQRVGSPALLLSKADIQGEFAGIRPRLAIGRVFSSGAVLFNDLGTKPRAWVAYKGRPIDMFDPSLLEADLPPLMEGIVLSAPSDVPDGPATVAEAVRYNRVDVRVEATPPGVLVLKDAWYPGWRATVDGKEAPVFPVDGLFRGVEVGEGSHEVTFYYAPYSFELGLTITTVAGCVTLIGMVYIVFVNRRRRHRSF